jgi:uncharacterized protein YjbI with pentapeptide repeats
MKVFEFGIKQLKFSYLLYFLLSVVLIALIWEPVEVLIKSSPFVLPKDPKEVIALRNEYWKILLQVIAGTIILIGLFFTYWKIRVSEEGQITDRFTRAIEQLGSTKIEVRLGGIFSLERISIDSRKDRGTIMQILASFVRENSSNLKLDRIASRDTIQKKRPSNKTEEKSNAVSPAKASSIDIQSALAVIGRRKRDKKYEHQIDLRYTDLRGFDFQAANFRNTLFWESNLQECNFLLADLREARLFRTNGQNSLFLKTDLRESTLGEGNFKLAKFWSANLEKANLSAANLQNALLMTCNLRRASMQRALMFEANLTGSDLTDADLWLADVRGAIFFGANLENANLQETNFEGATLIGADLLKVRNLEVEQLAKVTSLYEAKLDPILGKQVRDKYPHLLDSARGKKIIEAVAKEIEISYAGLIRGESAFSAAFEPEILEMFKRFFPKIFEKSQ